MAKRSINPKDPYIETYNGKQFHYRKPEFDIKDICWALSGIPRFAARSKFDYWVANHSVLVAKLCLKLGGNPREGLAHDMPEAFWMDLPSPAKAMVADYKKEEKTTYKHIAAWAGLPPKLSPITEHADILALFLEADILMPSRGVIFKDYEKYHQEVLHMKAAGIAPVLTDRRTAYEDLLRWWKKSENRIV